MTAVRHWLNDIGSIFAFVLQRSSPTTFDIRRVGMLFWPFC